MAPKNLTKKDVMSELQCSLRLFFEHNHPEYVKEKKDSPHIFNGNAVKAEARRQYPGGVMVETMAQHIDPFKQTEELMQDESVSRIYNAAFLGEDTEIFADILQRNGDGWDLIEVKSSTEVEDYQKDDITLQAHILNKAGVNLKSAHIMHIDKDFEYKGDGDYSGIFKLADMGAERFYYVNDKGQVVNEDGKRLTKKATRDILENAGLYDTDQVLVDNRSRIVDAGGNPITLSSTIKERIPRIIKAINDAKSTLANPQPEAEMSSGCNKPNVCSCKAQCQAMAPDDHISYLPRGHIVQEKMAADGINRISMIPNGALESDTHKFVREVVMSGKEKYIDGIKQKIDKLPFPHHFIDFESVQYALPLWKGVKPWRQVPFQWSDHVRYSNSDIEHKEFLDLSGEDPRRAFAETLVEECGHDQGTLIVYNKAFEQMIMRDLRSDFVQQAGEIVNDILAKAGLSNTAITQLSKNEAQFGKVANILTQPSSNSMGHDDALVVAATIKKLGGNDKEALELLERSPDIHRLQDEASELLRLNESLHEISKRVFDLLPEMRNHYYHPDMKGSWSIKKVLPCFVPGMGHDSLGDIQDGTEAQMAYIQVTDPYWAGDKEAVVKDAKEYCKYDTLSMLKLADSINERENMSLNVDAWRQHDIDALKQLPSEEVSAEEAFRKPSSNPSLF